MSRAVEADPARPKSPKPKPEAPRPDPAARLADIALTAAFLALTFLLGLFPLKDTDFWWHLKAGDLIRRTGQVPTFDTFTYGAEGHAWVDLHWIFQILLSWGYAHGGVVALNLAKCAITTLAVGLLIRSRKPGWPTWAMVLAWLPALLVLGGRMYIRPETLSLLYLAIVLAILFRWERRPWLAFALPVVQACWVNTQGLFLLEPIVIGFALLGALIRPGALSKERRGWWRLVGLATVLTGLACLLNPYGLEGVIYPIQLLGTMGNPIFKDSIGELKPLPKFIQEVGLDSLPLRLHLLTFALGLLSFALPLLWRGWVAIADRGRAKEALKGRKKKAAGDDPEPWRLPVFRALLFAAFSVLSLAATRNSHQFAAVVGTVTAWNFAEWAGAIGDRRLRLDPARKPRTAWPRAIAFGAVALAFGAVASGQFYAWSGEGRTVGIGEEPLWFPHAAAKFAGEAGMPDRMIGYHNGHPALYEYYWAPDKKTYTDARLEVMGPKLYKDYLDLGEEIGADAGGWTRQLDAMGRPAVLIDNLNEGNAALSATLLLSPHYRLVWYDPIASVFVHDSSTGVVRDHAVDFAARHFARSTLASADGPATLAALARSLRLIGTQCRARPGGDALAQAIFLVGLDEARRLRAVDPSNLDGWKQAGLIEYVRDLIPTEAILPRFRLPFDPVFDLPPARATYDLTKAREIDPSDGYLQFFLARLYQGRGMDEAAVPLLARFVDQPNKNLTQRAEKAKAVDQLAALRAKLGPSPATKWANLSELDRLVATLSASGRASTLADLMESAYRPEARPWEWADRLATIRLHLGEPSRARAIWLAAKAGAPAAPRLARIAATYLVEGDFEAARRSYREAIAADPDSFEAHYGLALLESDAGNADPATSEARLAVRSARNDHSRSAARSIFDLASPYSMSRKPGGSPPTETPR